MPVKISIIICTYNRADILPICLQSLADQTLDKNLFEVIIINNNSTDNTQEITESFSKNQPNFRVVIEPKQGLSHARNRGCFEAIGEYVAYSDDDCKVPKEWLAIATSIIDEQAPDIFGGPYYALYNSPKPEWFKDEYGSHVIGSEEKSLSPGEFLSGGNFFIKRILLRNLDGFNVKLGMTGNTAGYGEETELQIRLRNQHENVVIMYYPQLFVYHLVKKEKMLLKKVIYRKFQNGRYSPHVFEGYVSSKRYKIRKILENMVLFFALFISFPISHFFRDTVRYPFIENYFYEKGVRIFFVMGYLFETMVIIPFSRLKCLFCKSCAENDCDPKIFQN